MTMTQKNCVHNNRVSAGLPSVHTERRLVTPEIAGQLLAKNSKNRTVIKASLRKIEESIRRGEWVFNGEPIIIASSGRVLDGQHRLMACVNTGVSIDTNIVFGVDESVFETIDQGTSRTVGNVLDIDGEENYNTVAAALKNFWGFCKTGQVYDGGTWVGGFTAHSARRLLNAHPEIRQSVRMSLKCEHFKSKALLACLHYILSFSNRQFASELVEVIEAGGGDKDRPFHVLREHVIYSRLNRIPMGNRSLAAKTIRAFNAEVTGEWVKRLQFKHDGQFPLVVGLDYERLSSLV